MAREEVVSWKRGVNGNPIRSKNANPIFDSCRYKVEFNYDEVAELTPIVISERMYAQCDKNGNNMLLIDSFIDYQQSDQAMFLNYH